MSRFSTRLDAWRHRRFAGIAADVGNYALFVGQRFLAERMFQAAAALTYSTLLALVPLLVIAFAIFSAFPSFAATAGELRQLAVDYLLPDAGVEIHQYLSDFTVNASNLTAVGVVALAVSAILLLSTIESTLNRIWRVERPRPLVNRLLIFWTLLTLGPLLLGASFTLTSDLSAVVADWLDTGSVAASDGGGSLLARPLAALIQAVAFTVLFLLVPARPVHLRDAAIGGAISGILFEILKWVFSLYLSSSTAYHTIYGALAVLPSFLIWVYLCWSVIILGAVFASSFPDWWRTRLPQAGVSLAPADQLVAAVAVLRLLVDRAHAGGTVGQSDLQHAVPLEARDRVVERLRAHRYLVSAEDGGFVLARDLHRTSLGDLAAELELTLGSTANLAQYQEHAPVRGGSTKDRPATAQTLLTQLADAEHQILGVPLIDLLEGPASDLEADDRMAPAPAPIATIIAGADTERSRPS